MQNDGYWPYVSNLAGFSERQTNLRKNLLGLKRTANNHCFLLTNDS